MSEEIRRVFEAFDLLARFIGARPFGNGHINDTYLIDAEIGDTPENYILQRVNSHVFRHPEQVIANVSAVTRFLAEKLSSTQRDISRLVLHLNSTRQGKEYYADEQGNLFRLYDFIHGAVCLDLPESRADFYNSAVAFGNFQHLLSDFPVETLYETIPDFHNTEKRWRDLQKAFEKDPVGRASQASKEWEFFSRRREFYSLLQRRHQAGELPLRVTHNDTKLNNVMLDEKTRLPLCVIDLDTVMPGFSVHDFGDSIRFGASTAAEDEPDLSRVHFDRSLYDTYQQGFLTGCAGDLLPEEIRLLPVGAVMMTLECGMRFLTDFLLGDGYFKTAYETHNLVRCHTQMRLAEEMEQSLL